jgi:predicted phosphodiesterase
VETSLYSRRRFLRQALGAGLLAATGLERLAAEGTVSVPQAFRFAFLTDLHLMKDGAMRSAEGIAACLAAVEKLNPRPDFILCGGDLVHLARDLTVAEAERRLKMFLQIWHDGTSLPARWVFGNHDLVGTSNMSVSPRDPDFATGLFKATFQLPHLYYGFAHKGWRFVVLDDVWLEPDRLYIGELSPEDLAFARSALDRQAKTPTIVCTHIPLLSNLPLGLNLVKGLMPGAPIPKNLVCTNAGLLTGMFPGHDVRAVLCGHLHHYERLMVEGIPFINSGAVCGSYWKGPMMGCSEGYGVVDVAADGSLGFAYQGYGWKAG